jgi:hypothetical protein
MPWKNIAPMEEIIRFVMLAQSDRFTVTELCEQFGISRVTGYKHLERYAAVGLKSDPTGSACYMLTSQGRVTLVCWE